MAANESVPEHMKIVNLHEISIKKIKFGDLTVTLNDTY